MRPFRVLSAVLLLLAGCGPVGGSTGTDAASARAADPPFAPCAALVAPPASADPAAHPTAAGAPQPMPALDLPCFAGGAVVHTGQLRGPAVVNLWASWCAPCRAELPAFQRYAQRNVGRVTVVGVVTENERDQAQALAEDLGLKFPTLYDERGELRRALRRVALPVTLFVDDLGQIRHVYTGEPLDERTLESLAAQHLGVAAP